MFFETPLPQGSESQFQHRILQHKNAKAFFVNDRHLNKTGGGKNLKAKTFPYKDTKNTAIVIFL